MQVGIRLSCLCEIVPNFLSSKLAMGKGVVFEKVEALEIHFALHSLQAPSKAGAPG